MSQIFPPSALRIRLKGVPGSYSPVTISPDVDGTFRVLAPLGRCLIVAAGENAIGQAAADAFPPGVSGILIPMQPTQKTPG